MHLFIIKKVVEKNPLKEQKSIKTVKKEKGEKKLKVVHLYIMQYVS